jgi:hypothetical protein
MGISLAPTFLNIVMVFTWLIYVLLTWEVGRRMRDNMRMGTGIVYMMHVLFHLYLDTSETKEASRAVGKDLAQIIAHDVYTGRSMTSMKVFIPIVLVLAALNRTAQVFLPRMDPNGSGVILGTVVTLVFVGLLFGIKLRQPFAYGVLEAIFALGSCIFSLWHMGDTLNGPAVIGLFSSIYLMIRALDNISKGRDQWRSKRRGALALVKKLSRHEAVGGYRVWFAAIVRATGELFFVQSESREGKYLVLSKPPLDRNAQYSGVLFADGDAEELWKKPNPRAEPKSYFGYELRIVQGSFNLLLNPDPSKMVPTAPPPASSAPA